ncbi:MAG: hypothetical protein ABIU06_21415 [Anaerolineales bacterium]
MNKLAKLPTDITRSRGLALILTADKARAGMTELIANLILNGPLFVISASEWLPAYELTRMIRKKTIEVRETLNNLYTIRASTCYRLLDSLANISSNGEPILVLDFLHTFYEPDIPLRVRFHKLIDCCRQLKRLALYRPVVVMTQELPIEEYEKFAPALFSIADKTFTIEPELEQISQATLF